VVVAAYVEELTRARSPATVKQHLAALRMLFDWLVVGQVLPFNPASSVRGPRHVAKSGKTPILSAKETRTRAPYGVPRPRMRARANAVKHGHSAPFDRKPPTALCCASTGEVFCVGVLT